MKILNKIRKSATRWGLDVKKFNKNLNFDSAHAQLLRRLGINLTLDVGANIGQFGRQLRSNYEYSGQIISFEPLSSARNSLESTASSDPNWQVLPYALGDSDEVQMINIAKNSQSSSILQMETNHINAAPDSAYVGSEEVIVRRLDGLYSSLEATDKNVFLKLDVQGFEDRVLAGAEESLKKILAVRLEMSIRPLYQSEVLIDLMIPRLRDLGFHLVALEPNFVDEKTGALLQVDGLFSKMLGEAEPKIAKLP